jgi:transketolase
LVLKIILFKNMSATQKLTEIAKKIRYYSLISTTAAGSGHPTSSLSGADLMTVLMFGGFFDTDLENPKNPENDRLIFSKGHASPLFYAIYAALGKVSEQELLTLRQFDSVLEGHPTLRFPYTEAATGSLGQGLGIGVGYAINSKIEAKKGHREYKTYVLLGDSEMAEGSVWEAMQMASFKNLNNLVGIIDVNRLGQRGQTMQGHDTNDFKQKCEAFGWNTIVIDGHDLEEIIKAYTQANDEKEKPTMIIAKTLKGKGISFLENKDGWHGKALNKEQLEEAVQELNI